MKKTNLFFWIPVIYNGLCLLTALVVGITFLIGSQMPVTDSPNLPDIILFFFTLFDIFLMLSPVMLIVLVILSIFNLMRESTAFRRYMPLAFSTIMQGLLAALLVTSITQPVS